MSVIALIFLFSASWTSGVFSVQDWNLFDSDCQIIPTTNNGNEGENSRLNSLFATHPQLYRFVLQVIEELDITKMFGIDDIRFERIYTNYVPIVSIFIV